MEILTTKIISNLLSIHLARDVKWKEGL